MFLTAFFEVINQVRKGVGAIINPTFLRTATGPHRVTGGTECGFCVPQ